MADKYPSLSPYTYCANNPVILKDPDGRDYEVVVDEENKTITISAMFYTTNENEKKLQAGLDAWNSQSGKYEYTTGEKTYTVNFDLRLSTDNDFYGRGTGTQGKNMVQFLDKVMNGGIERRGVTEDGFDIHISRKFKTTMFRTLCHEIGHTLGIGEDYYNHIELMESGGDGAQILDEHLMMVLYTAGIHSTNGSSYDSKLQLPSSPSDAACVHTYNMIGSFRRKE